MYSCQLEVRILPLLPKAVLLASLNSELVSEQNAVHTRRAVASLSGRTCAKTVLKVIAASGTFNGKLERIVEATYRQAVNDCSGYDTYSITRWFDRRKP